MVDGHRLIGRNMDLNISDKCAYIIRTDAGAHKTLGLAYTFRDISPDHDLLLAEGIPDAFYRILPFMCDDVLNDAGLHVEVNMRHEEYWLNGEEKYSCMGTNDASQERVYMFTLPRYFGEHCATVEEAKAYVTSLNVFSQAGYWNYCFLISDAQGNSSLLEFSANEAHWLDEADLSAYRWLERYNTSAIGQTNFYLNQDAWLTQDIKSGEGRFITLQNGIGAVNSRSDMYDLMRKVQFSNFYLDYDECKEAYFDPRSELIGEVAWAVYNVTMDADNEDIVKENLNAINEPIRLLTRQQKQEKNQYWESTFTEVVDTNSRAIFVRMFENEDMLYLLDFNGTHKLNSIAEWID